MKFRGMVKWRPFAAIGEQFHGINEIIERQSHIPIPLLNEQKPEDIHYLLYEAQITEEPICVSYFKKGTIHYVQGKISRVDTLGESIYVENNRIVFSSITDVSRAPYDTEGF
ncbi:YolD-like family protein [Bacillus cereus]|uniref:YolD-like family protein n=1 Tax=Bacillus cereus TaxID=1396 RepID=UPI002100060A|nr:YolD-like family protein [Bacillus cereus]